MLLSGARIVGEPPKRKLELLVVILSYNQGRFIKAAVDSVLIQNPIDGMKILIHDDASVDGSGNTIQEIVQENPNQVFAILQNQNRFSQGINILVEIQNLYEPTFIARLDGDDFWISKDKLEKQITIMRSNPNIAVLAHSCFILDEVENKYSKCKMSRFGFLNPNLLAMCNFVSTATVMYRTDKVLPLPKEFIKYYIQDWPLWAIMTSRGKLYFLKDIYSVYRLHGKNGFGGRKNREFLSDTLGVNKMIANSKEGKSKLIWTLMLWIRLLASIFDYVTLGKTTLILNKICNAIVGIKLIQVDNFRSDTCEHD